MHNLPIRTKNGSPQCNGNCVTASLPAPDDFIACYTVSYTEHIVEHITKHVTRYATPQHPAATMKHTKRCPPVEYTTKRSTCAQQRSVAAALGTSGAGTSGSAGPP